MTDKEIRDIIQRYGLKLSADGESIQCRPINERQKKEILEAVSRDREGILGVLRADRERAKERQRRIDSIPGLKEIRAEIDRVEENQRQIGQAIEDGEPRIPSKTESRVAELKEKYIQAAAYLEAEGFTRSENDVKASTGRAAMEKIIDGEDPQEAIRAMHDAWSAHCATKIWD